MSSTKFIANQTRIAATWLNDVDRTVYQDWFNVRNFGAVGDGVADDTGAIAAALQAARATAYREVTLLFPAGCYRVRTIDLTGSSYLTLMAQGTVQLLGSGNPGGFLLGADGYGTSDNDTTFTRNIKMTGGDWIISPASGAASYTNLVRLKGVTGSTFENLSLSGEAGDALGGDRVALALDFAWVNKFYRCTISSPGAPGPGQTSYNVFFGSNNVNLNVFESCRLAAPDGGPPYADRIGFYISGSANEVRSCDVSALYTAFVLDAARGCSFSNNYHEQCTDIVVATTGNSRGNVFVGGFYEVLTNGRAFFLTSAQNNSIVSGRFAGVSGGHNRVFLDQGVGCYGLSIGSPELENIDTPMAGVYRGNAVAPSLGIWQGNALSFPSTPTPFADPNTLDAYVEGTWSPEGTGIALASASGTYTRIGDLVTIAFEIIFPATADGNFARISGLPFSAGTSRRNGAALGYVVNPGNHTLSAFNQELRIYNNAGAERQNGHCSGNQYCGTLTYKIV